jgi:hypothetical protein
VRLPDFSQREDLIEEMDRPDCPENQLFRTLDQFERINRLFSRYRTLLNRYLLADMEQHPGRPYRLVDLGAGGCDIGRWLVRQCRSRRLTLTITAIERDPRVACYARAACDAYPEIEVLELDVRDALPLDEADYVFANHLLHHLPDDACATLIQQLDHAGIRRFLLSDIVRSSWAFLGYGLCTRPFFHNSFIVADGLTSIRRGFTLEELRTLLCEIPARHKLTLHRLVPSRFVIIGGYGV